MSHRLRRVAACTIVLLAFASSAGAQAFGFPWWRTEQFQKDLGLTSDQSARIDAVFQAALAQLRPAKSELDRHEAELSTMIETNADEALVVRQVDKVEALRSSMNKTRTLMLLHMRQVLTPEQRVRLKALHDQRERDRKANSRDQRKQ
jgi:Spy/CpxP family protein refolding chaperone